MCRDCETTNQQMFVKIGRMLFEMFKKSTFSMVQISMVQISMGSTDICIARVQRVKVLFSHQANRTRDYSRKNALNDSIWR